MYNVMVLDDEEMICRGLKSKIERIGHSRLGRIWTVTDPLEARRMLQRLPIHIVIVDIVMPGMTGLEFIKEAKQECPSLQFIVLSGNEKFEYAKEAFKNGVVDYLLKPIQMQELEEVLGKTTAILTSEREISRQDRRLALENQLNRIIAQQISNPEALSEVMEQTRKLLPGDVYSVGLIYAGQQARIHMDEESLRQRLDSIPVQGLFAESIHIFRFTSYRNELVFLFGMKEESQYRAVYEYVSKVLNEMKDSLHPSVYASLSDTVSDLTELVDLYRQAEQAMKYRIIPGHKPVLEYKVFHGCKSRFELPQEQLQELSGYLHKGLAAKADQLIAELFNYASLNHEAIESIHSAYEKVRQAMDQFAYTNRLETEEAVAARDADTFDSLHDMQDHLRTRARTMVNLVEERQAARSAIEIAKQYVDEHYHKDISMALVANQVSMNYFYFSRQFKEETGMNFIDYLTKVRMEQAMLLLKDPMNKVKNVAEAVGYQSSRSFTKAFKSYFNRAPNEYR